ncbi:MAG: hypothetical protein Q8K67_11220 [Geothrix sp.]|nr:hypothetical protein [Geothrix sp.]
MPMPTKPKTTTPKKATAAPRRARTNPTEPEFFTVKLPLHMPKGLSYVYDEKIKQWVWQAKTHAGQQALMDMIRNGEL